MKQRHPYCQITNCLICLEDCDNLAEALHKLTKTKSDKVDILYEYRKWLDSQEIESEGDSGWSLPIVFEEETINLFVKDWNNG